MDNVIRVHFDGLDRHADDFLAYLEDYQQLNNLTDWQLFEALQYVLCSLLALFMTKEDISSDKKLLKKIEPIFESMMNFIIKNRKGFEEIIKNR